MSEDTKACPFCGEQILAVAIKCKHCGSNIDTNPAAVPPTQNKPASGFQAIARGKRTFSQKQILWALLSCSVICYFISEYSRPLGIIALFGLAVASVAQVRSVREGIVVGLAGAFLTLVVFSSTANRPAKPSEATMPVPTKPKAAPPHTAVPSVASAPVVDLVPADEQRSVPAQERAAQPPTGAPPRQARFPEIVARFIKMNKLKQDAFAAEFHGTVLSGSGEVFEVADCGWTDDSEKWGQNCLKVTLDKGNPRVVLYFGEKDKAQIASYDKGQALRFSGCVGIGIKNWGFWSTATCDMP